MEHIQRAQKRPTDLAGQILDATIQRDQIDVTDHVVRPCDGLTSGSPGRSQNFDAPKLARRKLLLGPSDEPS